MAGVTLEAFESQVILACTASPLVVGVSTVSSGAVWIRLRAHLVDDSFIAVFYNEATNKMAFALIKDSQRIFGADNRNRWHWHPFEAPESHVPTETAVTFDEFLRRVEEHFAAQS